jgi:sentrin-specific protease 7
MPDKPPKIFTKLNMPGHCVKVPQQNNFTDCGLYLLQYVEQFFLVSIRKDFESKERLNKYISPLQDPIGDYNLPIRHLNDWFDTLTVTKKREDISNLLKELISKSNPEVLPLPDVKFPTANGNFYLECSSFSLSLITMHLLCRKIDRRLSRRRGI